MSSRPGQPGDPTPPPLNEEHMLEWIEGKLSRIEESNRSASTRAGVSERVRQMQANRRALQSLGDERAPAELMDRVMAALERDALVGLTNGDNVSDHPPINIATRTVTKRGNGALHRMAPQLALAAGLLLLVGGAAYWGSVLVKPKPIGPIATHNPTAPDAGDAATKREHERMLAEGTTIADEPSSRDATTMAMTAPAPAPEEMTDERILRLAREGRLVIRVGARDLSKLAQVEAMDTLKDGRTWRLSKDVPQEVVVALAPAPRSPSSVATEAQAPLITSRDPVNPFITRGAPGFPAPVLGEFTPTTPRTYLVDFPDTRKSLDAIKATLADRLKAEVEFEEMPFDLSLPRVEDPEAVLWWTLPPTSWTQRVTVPVVIESK